MQKNLKEVLCLYGEQVNAPHHKWPSKSVIITQLPHMDEFKSWRVFNEEPASKENPCMGSAQHARAYRSNFHWEKCWWSSVSENTEKEAFPQFTAMKTFSKFWFQQDGGKAHTADLT